MENQLATSRFVRIRNSFGRGLCLLLPLLSFACLQNMDAFRLTVESFNHGAWYQLWTGHLLHFTVDHFLWDAVMFAFLTLLLWREEEWHLWAWLFGAAPLISILLFFFDSGLTEYRGLSALDSVLYARVCWGLCWGHVRWQSWVFGILPLAGFFGKIVFELITGTTLFVSDLGLGVEPLPLAHLFGFVLGTFWALLNRCGLARR
jgi:hypothetical protein